MEYFNSNGLSEWIAEEFKNTDSKVEYWHYTSLGAILSMFKDYIMKNEFMTETVRNCTIWASNVRYMNDPEEYRDGLKMLERYANDHGIHYDQQKVDDRYCLISFSEAGDNLGHWKWYGKESGVSICFNMRKIESSMFKLSNNPLADKRLYDGNNRPVPVYYTEEEKEKYLTKIKEAIEKNLLLPKYLGPVFVPFCKDESYVEEKEDRMVFYENDERCDYVYNTTENMRIKPALNIKMRLKELDTNEAKLLEPEWTEGFYATPTDNIITKLIVGPGVNQELVFNALIHAFDRKHYRFLELNQGEELVTKDNEEDVLPGECVWLKAEDGKRRFTYKCYNGIFIMKSACSFRG